MKVFKDRVGWLAILAIPFVAALAAGAPSGYNP